jgi:L-aspartate oxidase
MKHIRDYQVIVVGAGAAGLTAALHLAPLKTLVINKVKNETGGSSPYAQGGIASATAEGDSPELHFQDTLIAGDGLCNREMVTILTEEAGHALDFLLDKKMPFDRDEKGSILYNQEGSHSRARILRSKGDSTGAALMDTLRKAADEAEHITCREGCMAWDLHLRDKRAVGLFAWDDEDWIYFECDKIILAAGGAGQVFSCTTNPSESTGDTIALAGRAGVPLNMMEMIQFHPTALNGGKINERIPLVTEAMRGAGAQLIDETGRRIMEGVHHLKELAPRDVVARVIWNTINRGGRVFLDGRNVPDVENHFPTVSAYCRENGIDIRKDPIPVTPAAHYLMGGVLTDAKGRTNIMGLWCVGESAGTGLHGANRLASNSLLECLVFGIRTAGDVRKPLFKPIEADENAQPMILSLSHSVMESIRRELQELMFTGFGPIRTRAGMKDAEFRLKSLDEKAYSYGKVSVSKLNRASVRKILELENLLYVARKIAHAALDNPVSRGAHFLIEENRKRITA